MIQLNPPLKWAGGKRWLVPILKPLWSKYSDRRLVEPLCGGISISLGLNPQRALLNDINEHLINFYKTLQVGLIIEIEMKSEENYYYQCRRKFNSLIKTEQTQSVEAASLFYYLNHTCYNGLCRYNNKGEFNVPFGKYKKVNYQVNFTNFKELLSEWEFTSNNYDEIDIESDDFIYADPPYDVEFRQYSKEGFSFDEQEKLVKFLSKQKVPVVLSNQATSRIMKLYKDNGFELVLYSAPRMINCTGNRTRAVEVLAFKNL